MADSIYKTMVNYGISPDQAKAKFWLIDRAGLLTEYTPHPTQGQLLFLRSKQDIADWKVQNPQQISLLEVIENVHPTILIGSSAVSGAFTQQIIATMAQYVERPIILPLSNPTEKAEATPENIIKWTNGKALIAAGSPFADVVWQGKSFPVSQCNNYFAFPGIGLGVIAVQAKTVSEGMLKAASQALSESTQGQPDRLLPTLDRLPASSRAIAIAVANAAVAEGLAQIEIQGSIEFLVDRLIWKPHYLPYKKINQE